MAETIIAISTPEGEGGIGIVRVSGAQSLAIMKRIMLEYSEPVRARHAYFGHIVDGGEIIDEAIFLYMKGPASYTGEDMLEVQAHGSNAALRRIIEVILGLGLDSVRMAEPGEFTKLAFLNGKMDLAQAEAVIDIINAKTDVSLSIAESQREGRLSDIIEEIRGELLDLLAQIAVDIDYPDEDEENVGSFASRQVTDRLRLVATEVDELIDTIKIGRIAREGVRAAIIGKPNAGKSSLMNAVLGEGRVIVTDIPGTTRDTVEESANLGGLPIVLVDTAGLRETDDKVERIGIEKTKQAIMQADIVILVLDGSEPLDDEDEAVIAYLDKISGDRVLVIINKQDLGQSMSEDAVQAKLPDAKVIRTSLVGRAAIDAARLISESIREMYDFGSILGSDSAIITSERHAHLLRKASAEIYDAIRMLESGEPLEVVDLSAHYAYDSLGKIVGEDIGDEVLDRVFSKFCLGK